MSTPGHVLVTGGCRSGKSRHAIELTDPYDRRCYIATASPFDDEMKQRIERHQADRGDGWTTIEEPLFLAEQLLQRRDKQDIVVVDCLTLWVSNWMLAFDDPHRIDLTESAFWEEVDDLAVALSQPGPPVVLVTNEVGLGIVPDNALARRFRDLAGLVNQRIAQAVDRVVFMVSGISWVLKDRPSS